MVPSTVTSSPHLALLRGVNVGGKNRLPMKLLAQMFLESGCTDVRTYIQSGNVVFNAPARLSGKLPAMIAKRITEQLGFRIPLLVRSADEIEVALRHNPFLASGADPKTLHVMFLADTPTATAIAMLDPARSPNDSFAVHGREIYLQLPNGVSNSKLTNAYFDARLSTTSTSRNWATVSKLAEWMGVRGS